MPALPVCPGTGGYHASMHVTIIKSVSMQVESQAEARKHLPGRLLDRNPRKGAGDKRGTAGSVTKYLSRTLGKAGREVECGRQSQK